MNKNMLNIERDLTLLLTAAIDVKIRRKNVTLLDPAQRQQQYIDTLIYYAKNHPHIKRIVFAENSGWPLDKIKKAVRENPYNKKFEFISFDCGEFSKKYGKSHGEAQIIREAMEKSVLCKQASYIAKLTGRIRLLNITGLLEKVPARCDLSCEAKEHNWIFLRLFGINKSAGPYCDTRFFLFSKRFYTLFLKRFFEEYKEKGFYLELELYRLMKEAKAESEIINRFPVEPLFSGKAGHFQGKSYNKGAEVIKRTLLSLIRKIAPFLHF
ncbi:MAG: hypothetical protein JSW17_03590 [Candidatus Omnitrophota bacterium]|nr:MAG: hypothetical protein JSW17_03590 [Candidatus Omnitrophota bacterium]